MSALRELFFNPNQIPEEQIEVFDVHNYQEYDRKLADDGGLDLLLMGLGGDGHFCGNLAGTMEDIGAGCRAVQVHGCEPVYRTISEALPSGVRVPEFYVTFGPATVMQAKEVVMIVNGRKKAENLKRTLEGPVVPEIPASILQLHPNFTVIADEEAACLLNRQ